MPVHRVRKNGKPGYRWGKHGKVYTYKPGSKKSREAARRKAARQGRAAYAHGYRG